MLADALGQHFAALRWKQFRIAQPAHAIARIENHRRRHHATEERPASYFIHARDQSGASAPGQFFVAQRAAQFLQQAQLGG
jgi:hypothetical protein